MLTETAIKVNPKYIENPFSISEFLEFLEDILKENSPLNGVYKATNRLRAVELVKGILDRNINFQLTDSLVQLLKKPKTIKLVLITEPWSIDTANILRTLESIEMAGLGKIQLMIFLRENNTDITQKILNDTNTPIPRLLVLDRKNEIKWIWGPRTENAEMMLQNLKAKGTDKMEQFKLMQEWYVKDNTKSFQKEFEHHVYEIFSGL
jgi:hypothetical protein